MKISLIAAIDEKHAIGASNQLMWHLPDDFKWFKTHTKGKPMLMGRNTMLSLGKPLPGRINLVLSSSSNDIIPGFIHVYNWNDAKMFLPENTEELMVIGGGKVYQDAINNADVLYITIVNHVFDNADTFFPKWNANEWHEVFSEHHAKDDNHAYSFDFKILEKIK
ncbi:MAG: dihydrofolate reductase [Bacteroidota bacterium]|nr:dihydrofolate reductase [Bacteroidota bacterium]